MEKERVEMIKWLLLAVACLVLTPLQGSLDAGCHAVAIQQQAVVAYQPIAAPYYYSVGANLQAQASEERIANLVIQKLQAAQLNSPKNLDSSPQTLPLTAESQGHSIIKARCIGCHGTKAEAMAALPADKFLEHLTGDAIDDYKAREKMMGRMLDGTMPPSGPLPGDVLGNALGQIVGAKTAPQ